MISVLRSIERPPKREGRGQRLDRQVTDYAALLATGQPTFLLAGIAVTGILGLACAAKTRPQRLTAGRGHVPCVWPRSPAWPTRNLGTGRPRSPLPHPARDCD